MVDPFIAMTGCSNEPSSGHPWYVGPATTICKTWWFEYNNFPTVFNQEAIILIRQEIAQAKKRRDRE